MPRITPLQFLQTLYPELERSSPDRSGRLVLWTKSRRSGKKHTDWPHSLVQAARLARSYRRSRDVYFGVALQDRDRALAIARRRRPRIGKAAVRGSEASATALPALWADLDVAGPGHSSQRLPPDRAAALGLLVAVPVPPSIIVDSGGGLHVYWLLREPLTLASGADRRGAKDLVRRLQAALGRRAADHGWGVDNTANLAQLLRVPGTLNYKLGKPRPVTVERFPLSPSLGDVRYAPEDFDALPEAVAAIDEPLLRGREREHGPPADFRLVLAGCAWLRHCYEDRTSLPEPEWYAALSIAGRCASDGVDGRRLAHRISRDHPGYRPSDTDDKLDQALERSGPRTCAHIAGALGQRSAYCQGCPHFGRIKSPIVLGAGPTPASASSPPKEETSDRPAKNATASGDAGDDRPRIVITTREDEVNDQAMRALARREPNVFQRGGLLVQVTRSDGRPLGRAPSPGPSFAAPPAPAAIKPVTQARLRELLARHCAFLKHAGHKDGGELKPAHPPRWTVQALAGRGAWPELRELSGLVEGPVLRPDGSVLQEPGFDPATGLVYAPALEFEPVPERPDPAQAGAALDQLREVVADFPFRCEAHRAAWLSSLLTPLARAAFNGPAPLNLIDANVRGTGKSLLADVCSTLLTGRSAARMSYSRDEDEIRKQITSIALEAAQLVLIDNVSGVFGSPTLDRALTAESWRDRLLGSNNQISVPLKVTWYATGNNVVLRGDTPRRCLHIRLESRRERPEQRTDFRHPRLLAWVRRERGRLLPAALTLLRAYAVAGRPAQPLAGWGSYEGWSDLVRSTVVWLGLPDPAETRDELEAASDVEEGAVRDLVHGLAELLDARGAGAATSKEILEELAAERSFGSYATLRLALAESFPRLTRDRLPTAGQLSMKLGSLRGRRVDGACLEQGPRTYKGVLWRVERLRQEVA